MATNTTGCYPIFAVMQHLIQAEERALELIREIEQRGLIRPGISENELSNEILTLAQAHFQIQKFWHKRIVRTGANTLCPYDENPPNRLIETDDIVFLDLGPILDEWEADLGRTYVLGEDPEKLALAEFCMSLWHTARDFALSHPKIRSAELYEFVRQQCQTAGYLFGGEIAGHLIGKFPHEKIATEKIRNYIHPENTDFIDWSRHWILEIHVVNQARTYGAFVEQLLR
jgi:Xaa-Pro dipeptidase